ncbi:hypothetical protein [Streptomyces cucumeris]|uniref:hypothetical protein n=1 Tax=Streptomyces cucumeris TaxID=2962890 RepID=UPI0020C8FF19|nr:hypothetical protein [Streptomyces sp. NEAU-Y11]MCP9213240.1 hypothetical protein [Streptomyces sp. NEAU-Y11]
MSEEEQRLRALTTDLLSGGEGSAHAAAELVGEGLVGAQDEVAVIVADANTDPEVVAAVITDATGRSGRDEPPARALTTTVGGRGAVLVASRQEVERAAAWWAEEVRWGVRQRDAEGRGVFVGVSNAGRLDGAADLFRQAVLAAFAAAELPELAPVVSWRDSGVYGPLMLAVMASPELVVPPGIADLSTGSRTDSLARTAEMFLDTAGDTAAASARLSIHRTTL